MSALSEVYDFDCDIGIAANDNKTSWRRHDGNVIYYCFDGLNRNAGIAALSGGYDARGNLTYDGTRTFTYDVLNRLYYKHSTDGAVDIALSYDPEGRLYGYNSGGAVTYFLYDGTDLIGEYSPGGAVLRRYVHSSRDDDPQVWLEGSSNTNISYVYTNYQGSVIATTNTAGSNLQIYKYSPYGEPRDASNNAVWSGFRFRYTGQQILSEARLYHYKAHVNDLTSHITETLPFALLRRHNYCVIYATWLVFKSMKIL